MAKTHCCSPARALAGALGCACLAVSVAATAADVLSFLPDTGDANLTFYLDNDLFADTDEDYTNGARLSWISGSRSPSDFGWAQKLLRKLNGDSESRAVFRRLSGFSDPEDLEYNYGMSITQLMFTPESTNAPAAPPGERPYAGWLGVDLSLHTKDAQALNSASVAVGTTGPHSLAEQTQDFFHDLLDQNKFAGWDSQIPNELTVNLYYTQRRRIGAVEPQARRLGVDGFWESRLALGNFRTELSVGGLVRFG
jgi:lipid A 3-O-deacylase